MNVQTVYFITHFINISFMEKRNGCVFDLISYVYVVEQKRIYYPSGYSQFLDKNLTGFEIMFGGNVKNEYDS